MEGFESLVNDTHAEVNQIRADRGLAPIAFENAKGSAEQVSPNVAPGWPDATCPGYGSKLGRCVRKMMACGLCNTCQQLRRYYEKKAQGGSALKPTDLIREFYEQLVGKPCEVSVFAVRKQSYRGYWTVQVLGSCDFYSVNWKAEEIR